MTGIILARGNPYQYDDPEGVVNKEDEAEGDQAKPNQLVRRCGLQRERESERDPQGSACAGAAQGTCCWLHDHAAAGPGHRGGRENSGQGHRVDKTTAAG